MSPRPIRRSPPRPVAPWPVAGLLTLGLLLGGPTQAEIVGETLLFLDPDGRNYLIRRAVRSDAHLRRFHVDKRVRLQDFSHIDPNRYEWDDSAAEVNTLSFHQGDFVVMYPGRFPDRQLQAQEDGSWVYQSWDGTIRPDGHFGIWNEPGDFDRFVYAWILPPNLELLGYDSNRPGEWVRRNKALSFFAERVNDLSFRIRFRERDSDGDGVSDRRDRCPETPAGTSVGTDGCERDDDADGIGNALDRCPQTDPSARVDTSGCELDSDADGVVDHLDRCASTAGDTLVDDQGCATDLDRDGVADRRDLCPDTLTGAAVDRAGCEIDCDGDGLINSLDRCPNTPYGTPVDAHGCPLDGDGDGIADGVDQCPQTPPGGPVDAFGCALDSDGDGVSDGLDVCPETPAQMAVGDDGCMFDGDLDGVLDNRDLCPDTARDTQVDATGCVPVEPIRLEGVSFVTNSAELTAESKRVLDRVALTLRGHPDLRLEVAGHTDKLGDSGFNLALSQTRAETVRSYLIGRGVEAGRLTARGYGEARPVASNDSGLGRAANRRVELRRRSGPR